MKCLTFVDEYTRERLAIDVAGSIRSARVIEVLSMLIRVHGAPRYRRSDNVREMVSSALLKWVVSEKIESVLIDPCKPWQNGSNESLNGKFRDEYLAMEWLRNRIDATVVIDDWRQHYNELWPQSSLNYDTPLAYRQRLENDLTHAVIARTEWS